MVPFRGRMFRTRLVIGVDGRPTEMMERMQGGGDGYSKGCGEEEMGIAEEWKGITEY